jgi:hypothetical protein
LNVGLAIELVLNLSDQLLGRMTWPADRSWMHRGGRHNRERTAPPATGESITTDIAIRGTDAGQDGRPHWAGDFRTLSLVM